MTLWKTRASLPPAINYRLSTVDFPAIPLALVAYTCQLLLTSLPPVKHELHAAEMERRAALWRKNPQPLPATPQAFANAVFERVLGTKIPSAAASRPSVSTYATPEHHPETKATDAPCVRS